MALTVKVYADYSNKENPYYVRILGKETRLFPFGLSVANSFSSKKEAEDFAKEVLKYIAIQK